MLGKRLTGVLLALVAVAISGFAASSASAVFVLTSVACSGGTNVAACYENAAKEKLELTGSQAETVAGGTTKLTVPSVEGLKIECTTATGSGTIVQNSPLTAGSVTTITSGVLNYSGCSIAAPATAKEKCVIPSSKSTETLAGELKTETEILLKPASGTKFIVLPFTSKSGQTCPAAFIGEKTIKGEQQVKILNPATPAETKAGEAIVKSKLKFGEEAAELEESLTLSFTGLSDKVYVSKIA
jgi:hypothetical protein